MSHACIGSQELFLASLHLHVTEVAQARRNKNTALPVLISNQDYSVNIYLPSSKGNRVSVHSASLVSSPDGRVMSTPLTDFEEYAAPRSAHVSCLILCDLNSVTAAISPDHCQGPMSKTAGTECRPCCFPSFPVHFATTLTSLLKSLNPTPRHFRTYHLTKKEDRHYDAAAVDSGAPHGRNWTMILTHDSSMDQLRSDSPSAASAV